jgi:carboxyl-terminal processing protease
MPPRNVSIILLTIAISLTCYLRASRNRYVESVAEAMNVISREYVDEVDQRKLFEGAMDGMVGQLDEYSGYHPPEEYEQFQEDIDQEFVGIGVVVEYDAQAKRLSIVHPLVGTPAYRAGVKPGDVIREIDGQRTDAMNQREATRRIKGPAGTKVRLVLERAGSPEPIRLEIERASIAVDSVLGDLRDPDGKWVFRLAEQPQVGYIRVTSFGERTAEELRTALATLRDAADIKGLVLDLRGNEGGLLESAVEVCDMFLDSGVIVKQVGRHGVLRKTDSATAGTEIDRSLPIIVLVDRFSASASEIVAACLQDHGRARVGGQRSWGKGTVQNVVHLEGGRSALRLTIARFVRPNGKNIHKQLEASDADDWGVRPEPELELVLTEDQYRRFRKARWERDRLTSSGLLTAGEAASSPPAKALRHPQPPGAEIQASQSEPDGRSGLEEDPQLRKAVAVLVGMATG